MRRTVCFCTVIPSAIRPFSDPTPSNADIKMTKQIAGSLGIAVHDHIVVGKNEHAA